MYGTDKYLKNCYIGPYRVMYGTDKYLKTPIYGNVWDRQIFKKPYMGPYRDMERQIF